VCLKNGLLHLKDWRLYPHNPGEYYTAQLDCDFAEQIPDTPAFDNALAVYCEESSEKMQFMLQFLGAVFSNVPGYKFKRFLLTIGERDSGKTIMKRLAEIIVGVGNYNNCDLSDLENNHFAAASLHLKKLSGTNDLRSAKIPEVGRLLQLTGGDSMRVERKGEQDFSMIYTGYIWHVGNNKPIYGGTQNEALYLREILFELNHTIPQDAQDHHLLEKLLAERQGIILRCLQAARKAIYDNDYRFDVPAACERSKAEHKRNNNVVSQFLAECAVPLDLKALTKAIAEKHTAAKVWQAFKAWREECSEYKGLTRSEFEQELATLYHMDVKDIKPNQHSGDIVGRFYPVMLNDEGIRYNHDIFLS
jgi:P4 family phage/plasmid primase-like protien